MKKKYCYLTLLLIIIGLFIVGCSTSKKTGSSEKEKLQCDDCGRYDDEIIGGGSVERYFIQEYYELGDNGEYVNLCPNCLKEREEEGDLEISED